LLSESRDCYFWETLDRPKACLLGYYGYYMVSYPPSLPSSLSPPLPTFMQDIATSGPLYILSLYFYIIISTNSTPSSQPIASDTP